MERLLTSAGYRVYTLRVSDRFGDHGLVGAAIVLEEDGCWRIDSLLMSCRVMGLGVETAFLHRICVDARQAGIATMIGEFVATKKNQPAGAFYLQHGFRLLRETEGHQLWGLDLAEAKIERPAWVWVGTTGMPGNHED